MRTSTQHKIAMLRRMKRIGDWQVEMCQVELQRARDDLAQKTGRSDELRSELETGDELVRKHYRAGIVDQNGVVGAMMRYQNALASSVGIAQHAAEHSRHKEESSTENLKSTDALRNAFKKLELRYTSALQRVERAREGAMLDDLWSMRRGRHHANYK